MASTPDKVLIVHPENQVRKHFERCVRRLDPPVDIQCNHRMPENVATMHGYQLVIACEDSRLDDGSTFFDLLSLHPPSRAVILISANGSVQRAVTSVKMGVKDYLLKDAEEAQVMAAASHALHGVAAQACTSTDCANPNGQRSIITTAASMQNLLATAARVANASATVLIEGESGTGKELLARYIHQKSRRADRRFYAMNCAALPENLAESELFGYEKGAFTGANSKRAGKFEQAHQSTLLLDEISEMPLALQVKLLRVLQEKEVDHIGGKAPIVVDTRVIATTNRNLAQMVSEGKFREDLFYRLRVIPLKIPPLRERREDIQPLAAHFLSKHCPRDLPQPPRLSKDAVDALTRWPWPGNVRELENTMERAVLISDGDTIGTEALLLDGEMVPQPSAPSLVGSTVRELERKLIGETLVHVNQNRTHAAKMLGISIRTLRNKLKEYQTQSSPSQASAIGNSSPQ